MNQLSACEATPMKNKLPMAMRLESCLMSEM